MVHMQYIISEMAVLNRINTKFNSTTFHENCLKTFRVILSMDKQTTPV